MPGSPSEYFALMALPCPSCLALVVSRMTLVPACRGAGYNSRSHPEPLSSLVEACLCPRSNLHSSWGEPLEERRASCVAVRVIATWRERVPSLAWCSVHVGGVMPLV